MRREERLAKNEVLFREINERVKDLNDTFRAVTATDEWICECASRTCTEKVQMSVDEYEAIRALGDRFFVAPSDEHFWPDVERVVERNDRYWIVEKIGVAGQFARQADPRESGDGPLPLHT